MTVEPVAIPLPYNRLWTGILAGLFVLAGVISVPSLPAGQLWVAIVVPAVPLAVLLVVVVRRGAWLEGTTLVTRTLRTHRVELAGATSVQLVGNRGGVAVLLVRDDRDRAVLAVLTLTQQLQSGLPGWVCTALADGVAAARDAHGQAVAKRLRAQAAHLDGGGELRDSPLAPLTRGSLLSG